ncbi:MAG: 5-formyltetrahydrofolate cyclo-ligase [Kiritimatiellae bacterium]|nr:5-formyltetrahydrofolate cyclo-ligase [Kiritimatiellia bacterium]
MMVDKGELRDAMRAYRRAEPAAARAAASDAVCRRLADREEIRRAIAERRPIAAYLAAGSELSVDGFIFSAARRPGALLAVPRWNGTAYELAAVREPDGPMASGPLGIREPGPSAPAVDPASIAVWIVPGLAFTADGIRLGQGGGWYDRLLAESALGAAKLGIAYDFQLVPCIPAEPHDVRMTAVVTPGLSVTAQSMV